MQHMHLKHSYCLRIGRNERKYSANLYCSPVEINAITTVKVPPLLELLHFLKQSFLCSCTAAGPPDSLASLYMKYFYLMRNSDFPKH